MSKKLAEATGLELYPLDLIEYKKNGERVPLSEYSNAHEKLLNSESWIIDGLGTLESFWLRIEVANTLIFVDLPYSVHYWWITKRLLNSFLVKPAGWPEGSSVWKGTLASWKYLRLSPKFWTPEFFNEIQLRSKGKEIYQVTSVKELNKFVNKY